MQHKQICGFIMGELIVALTVLGTLVVTLTLSLDGVRRFNHYQWTRERCLAAAQAQLDCYAACRRPLARDDVARLWPRVTTTVTAADGRARWEGLTLVAVEASSQSYRRQVRVRLARYCIPSVPEETP
jgi:hypothetical protein